MPRTQPNIVVAGTPGVGKSSHCKQLAKRTKLKHISVNDVVREKGCHEGRDEERDTWIVDEDKLLDELEDEIKDGGNLVDWHAADTWPESWIDLVVVLRVRTEILYDRLKARKYSDAKLQENIDAEIMQVILDEAYEAFKEEMVVELRSESEEDQETNCARIESWIENWRQDQVSGAGEIERVGRRKGQKEKEEKGEKRKRDVESADEEDG